MRKTTTLTLMCTITAISVLAMPMIAALATTPTEVVREKNHYFFKIHGGPMPGAGQPSFGLVEFIYKNLSPYTQHVIIYLDRTDAVDLTLPSIGVFEIASGENWHSLDDPGYIEEGLGKTTAFTVDITEIDGNGIPVGTWQESGEVLVPPPIN